MKNIKKLLFCIIIISLLVIPKSQMKNVNAADGEHWTSYFSADEDWWEGASGSMTVNTPTSFTAAMSVVGWGGCWGGLVYKSVNIKKDYTYNISFDIQSSKVLKFVYVKIADGENVADSFWVKCPGWNQTVRVDRYFTAKSDANRITFGIGGEPGDRAGMDADGEYRYEVFDSQNFGIKHQQLAEYDCFGDFSSLTDITVSNFKLQQAPKPIPKDDVKATAFGNQVALEWKDQVKGQKYNVYLDGQKIASSLSGKSYIINNVPYGLHKVSVSTVSNGKESSRTTIIVKVNGKGKIINTKTIKLKKLKAKKRALVIKWKRRKDVTGYQIQYSLKKNFKKKAKKIKIVKATTSKKTIKGLKSKKKYYVRIRSFINSYGKSYYSKWSKKKAKKTK